jgi:hypothetical protein
VKYVPVLFLVLILAFCTHMIVRDTDLYKKTMDPVGFWTDKVNWWTELVESYRRDVETCSRDMANLQTAEAKNLWIRQRALESLTAAEATKDYEEFVHNSHGICDTFKELLARQQKDLEDAKVRLNQELERASANR